MALTKSQTESIKKVNNYFLSDEEKNFSSWLSDNGWGDDEIEAFEKMSYGGKMMFMQEHKLTGHVYYHLMNLKSIG